MSAPATTPETVARRTASIQDGIARITTAAESFADLSCKNLGSTSQAWETTTAQNQLMLEIKKLLLEVQGPMGSMFEQVEVMCRTAAIRSLMEIGVFKTLPADGNPMTAVELVQKLDVPVEKTLLVRLMRNVTITGPLVEVDEETYAQTPFSQMYTIPDIIATFKHITDEAWPSLSFMSHYFRETGWNTPVDPTNCPYTFAHRTNGKESWEYMAQFSDRQQNSNRAMMAQSFDSTWSIGLYPFAEHLTSPPPNDSTTLVVDVGGGVGHTSRNIRDLCAGIPGRIVLQDRVEVVDKAFDTDGVVTMAHDFFQPQPVKGARIYYLRRILHDWADPACVQILQQIAAAMDPHASRVVIADQVLPNKGVAPESAFIDTLMMTITGGERTEKQWIALLAQAGLQLERFYKAPGTAFGVVEARVAAEGGEA